MGFFEEPTEEERRALAIIPRDAGDDKEIDLPRIKFLIAWARQFALSVLAGDVIYMYGKPWVTDVGAIKIARRYKEYKGYSVTLLNDSQKEEKGFDKSSYVAECRVYVEGYKEPVIDWGEITQERIAELKAQYKEKASYLPIVKYPKKKAMAEAIRRAHKRAFPLIPVEEE